MVGIRQHLYKKKHFNTDTEDMAVFAYSFRNLLHKISVTTCIWAKSIHHIDMTISANDE